MRKWIRLFQGKRKQKKAFFKGFGEGDGRLHALQAINCDTIDGSLKAGLGLVPYYDISGKQVYVKGVSALDGAHVIKLEKNGTVNEFIYAIGKDGYLYYRKSGVFTKVMLMGKGLLHHVMKGESGTEYHMLSASNGVYYTADGANLKAITTESVRGSCICGMRYMYALKKGEVHYSAPLHPYLMEGTDSNGGGIVYMPKAEGDILGIKAYGDSAYVFMERAVYRLTPAAEAKKFTMRKVEYGGSKICGNSMIASGRGVLFMTGDGLYIVSDNTARRFCKHIATPNCQEDYFCSVGRCGDLVLIDYKERKGTEEVIRRLAINAEKEDGYFACTYAPLCEDGLTFWSGYLYTWDKICASGMSMENVAFKGIYLNFGTSKRKRLHKICLTGEGDGILYVYTDNCVKAYEFGLPYGTTDIQVIGKGKYFQFELNLFSDARVDTMEVYYTVEE